MPRHLPSRASWAAHASICLALLAGIAAPFVPAAPAARAGEPLAPAPTRAATFPSPRADPLEPPRVTWHGPRTERVVALTFDDGWNAGTLRKIYRILARERVPATFFVTGIYVQRAPELWRQIATSGFPLANHSYLHRDARHLTSRQMAADLALTREAVEKVTGVPMLPLFRPPGGHRTPTTDREAAAAGFPGIVMWDVTAGDTAFRPSVASVVRRATAGRPGSIVLLHAGPRVTPRALPRIIARYRARGFRFVTLAELLGVAAVRPADAGAALDRASRLLDRSDAGPGSAEPAVSAPPDAGVGRAVPSRVPAVAPPPAAVVTAAGGSGAPGSPPPEAPPPARDAAWARDDRTPVSVAVFTVVLLAAVLAAAAAAGRTRAASDHPPG